MGPSKGVKKTPASVTRKEENVTPKRNCGERTGRDWMTTPVWVRLIKYAGISLNWSGI